MYTGTSFFPWRNCVGEVVRESDYPSQSSVEVKKVWGYVSRLLLSFKTWSLITSIVQNFNLYRTKVTFAVTQVKV
jgi:hypothetical protein